MSKPIPFLLLAAVFLSCEGETATHQDIPLESFRNEVEATEVKVGLAEQRSFDYLVNASGKVEAREQIRIIVERSGYLAELPIKEGDKV
jgi:multidrug efflux pump subunit AcrA (membrane-fusion protein)